MIKRINREEFTECQKNALKGLTEWADMPPNGHDNFMFATLKGKAGTGKAQPNFCILKTPNGDLPIGNAKIGDEIFTKKGKISKITGVYPQGKREVFEIKFNDGSITYSDKEHIWNVRYCSGNSRKSGFKNKTLSEIFEKGIIKKTPRDIRTGRRGSLKWEIPVCDPLEYHQMDYKIDPYTLGVVLGDASCTSNCVGIYNYKTDSEIIEKVHNNLIPYGYKLSKIIRKDESCNQYNIIRNSAETSFKKIISSLNLNVKSLDKFIPKEYMLGSIRQRMELLRGLMDTDGTICSKNKVRFSTSSKRLAKDVQYLVRSLGGICTINSFKRKNIEYNLNINIKMNPFSLKRKANLFKEKKNLSRYIESINPIGSFKSTCIMIEDEDHLYLTDDFIVTHNTTIIRYLFEDLIEEDENRFPKFDWEIQGTPQVVGITLSHKAKKVLSESIHCVATFAKFYGMKPQYNSDGSINYIREKGNSKRQFPCDLPIRYLVVDECSMVSVDMMEKIRRLTHPSTKIIFLGDPAQLPPIESYQVINSPGYNPDKDSVTFDLPTQFNLSERVRQTKGNPIIDVSDVIYDEIFSTQNLRRINQLVLEPKLIKGKGYSIIDSKDFAKSFSESIDNNETYLKSKIIAYKNKTVDYINSRLRNYILDNPDMHYVAGDIIYMKDSFYKESQAEGNKLIKGGNYILYNSEEYKITDVGISVVYGVECYICSLDKKDRPEIAHCENPYIPIPTSMGMLKYKEIEVNLKNEAVKLRNNRADKKMISNAWKAFYNWKSAFGNVSYGFCYTGHKIQGSTYDKVYIHFNDIMTVSAITPKRKLQALYTAITRARENVYFII